MKVGSTWSPSQFLGLAHGRLSKNIQWMNVLLLPFDRCGVSLRGPFLCLYWFPMAALTNCHKLSAIKQHTKFVLIVLKTRSPKSVSMSQSEDASRVMLPPKAVKENLFSLLLLFFLGSRAFRTSLGSCLLPWYSHSVFSLWLCFYPMVFLSLVCS